MSRIVSIWFPYLLTDWFSIRNPEFKEKPFVLKMLSRGRMIIKASNQKASKHGVLPDTVLADARAVVSDLMVADYQPAQEEQILRKLALWSIRFTPTVAVDLPDGLILDASGCAHLWGGERQYLTHIEQRLHHAGFQVRLAMANTRTVAWGLARYAKTNRHIQDGTDWEAYQSLPPQALHFEEEQIQKMHKLGLHTIRQVAAIPRSALRKRFGNDVLLRIEQARGQVFESIDPVVPPEPFHERLHCLEPISTQGGIEIALQKLLEKLCGRLQKEQKGLRQAIFKGYRIDGKETSIQITTSKSTHHVTHIAKLFSLRLQQFEPGPGIELFTLDTNQVEELLAHQQGMWDSTGAIDDERLSELIDRIGIRIGTEKICRYFPAEHHWPERSFTKASSIEAHSLVPWNIRQPRPLRILSPPEKIEVTAPIPDYPPMLFIYQGKRHSIVKADGPERIEQEWWIQNGQHRDYYRVEDDTGKRYWLFRLGHYEDKTFQWYIHGFFS